MDSVLSLGASVAHYVLLALGAAIAALAVLAPATSSDVDNRVLAVLQKVLGYVEKFLSLVLPNALHPASKLKADAKLPG